MVAPRGDFTLTTCDHRLMNFQLRPPLTIQGSNAGMEALGGKTAGF